MSHNRSIALGVCFLTVTVLTTGLSLFAADAGDGGKVVPIKAANGSTGNVKVKEADPYKNLHVPPPSEKYDPRNYSMNQTSTMANKPFAADTLSVTKKNAPQMQSQQADLGKSYNGLSQSDMTQNKKNPFSSSTSNDYSRSNSQYKKDYATSESTMGRNNEATAFNTASKDQNRSDSTFNGKQSKVFASDMSKQYLGPGAQHVPDGSVKENVVISHLNELPNRPLTIDEVRGLINHGFKPDTSAPPEENSKPMNDPNYTPQASPEPPDRIAPAPAGTDDDKSGILPSPGTLAQPPPENSVPLPQH